MSFELMIQFSNLDFEVERGVPQLHAGNFLTRSRRDCFIALRQPQNTNTQASKMPCAHEHHDCDHDSPDRGAEASLFCRVNIDSVTCLNEQTKDSIRQVFKPWDKRWDVEPMCSSDADDSLIVRIPFSGLVKIKSITILGPGGEEDPKSCKLYVNKDMDFDSVEDVTADQEFELVGQSRHTAGTGGGLGTNVDVPEYALKVSKFSNVRHLSIHIPDSFGGDAVSVSYIGLKGQFMQPFKEPISNLIYELNANPADHKVAEKAALHQGFGF